MSRPAAFTWIEKPLLAAMGQPQSPEDMAWLRDQGIEILLSLTEDPPRRDWLNAAGLLMFHLPVTDMEPPSPDQLETAMSAIARAHDMQMGVAVHCGAGLGRTGVVVACYFVTQGLSASNAIAKIRRLRPGSVETDDQAEAVYAFSRRQNQQNAE